MLCLKVATDGAWTAEAMRDVNAILVDHAHCEMKAASNALSLVARYPGDVELTRSLADLAREEIDHFQRVVTVLAARGVALGRPPVDAYAAGLRRAAGALPAEPGGTGLLDRLLVGALIEARSCERFRLLSDALKERGSAELSSLYDELLASEARHYRTFVDLARRVAHPDEEWVDARLREVARLEGELAARLEGTAAIHG